MASQHPPFTVRTRAISSVFTLTLLHFILVVARTGYRKAQGRDRPRPLPVLRARCGRGRWRKRLAAGGWDARHDGARFTDVQKRRLARLVVIAALVTGAVAGTALGAGGCGGATAGDGVTSPPSSSGT